ncbi:MAG: flippase-like domain-containing protein, partial [Methanocorpusculum sp.]|nr:flippase-like domain-containing protein [Methanocorpusculum sp.]
AFLVHMAAMCVWALRIIVMCKSLGFKVGFRHSLNMVCSGQLFASITPSQLGGEPVRVHELYKAKIPVADATAVVLIERLMEGFLLVISVIVSLTAFTIIYQNNEVPAFILGIAWFGTALCLGLLIFFILMMRKPLVVEKLAMKITGLFTKKMSLEKTEKLNSSILEGINRFYDTFRMFAGKARWGIIIGFLLTFLLWACEYSVASIILMGLGYPPHVLESIIFQIIIAIIFMIPLTPGSAGIAEAAYFGFYSIIMPSSVIGLFVLLLRMILYYSNIIIGSIASFIIVKREVKEQKQKDV